MTTAVVTGGSGALGSQIARRVASLVDVVVVVCKSRSRIAADVVSAIETGGGTAIMRLLDSADESAVHAFFEELSDLDLGCDVLVNAHGMSPTPSLVEETTLATWNETLLTNLTSVFLMCRSAVPVMKARGGGRIVTISSIHGRVTPATRAAYGASKHGLSGLTQALAREGAPFGINANLVCPGPVETPMVSKVWAEAAALEGTTFEQYYAEKVGSIPAGRLCETGEVAELVAYLASDCAGYVSGVCIDIAGAAT